VAVLSRLKGGLTLGLVLGAAELARLGKTHWDKLTPSQQMELRRLVKKAKARPDKNLTRREQMKLRSLVSQLELMDFAKTAGPTVAGFRRKQ
jgi:hypothetical protein